MIATSIVVQTLDADLRRQADLVQEIRYAWQT